jgi:NhaP-type Na+/H+ or K+/H+ antiporter
MGINNVKNGAITGTWFGALIFTFFGFQFMGITNIVSIQFVLTDIFISSIMGAVQGSIIGWSLGKFS